MGGNNVIERKKLQDFLDEDPSLKEKITYSEFVARKYTPNNTDAPIEEVYRDYRRIIEAL